MTEDQHALRLYLSSRYLMMTDQYDLYALFNKLKQFRRMATRYDKHWKTFAAALHCVAAFLIAKNL